MPNDMLNISHIITTGAKALAIFEVPRGWIKNRRMRMPQDVPTIVDCEMPSSTTLSLGVGHQFGEGQ